MRADRPYEPSCAHRRLWKDRSGMSQWGVQLVIGKLITDEDFRRHFQAHGAECLHVLRKRGIQLDDTDIAAPVGTDPHLWARTATRIDRRLRKSAPQFVMSYPVGPATPAPTARTYRPLTSREQQVLRGVFEGLTNKEIAGQVGASESAVKATLQQLFRKAHVRRRTQLVRVAIEGALDRRKTP